MTESSKMANRNAKDYMSLTSTNRSSEMNALISQIEQSVDTLSAIVLSKLDISQFKNNYTYVSSFTSSVADDVVEFANNTKGAITAYIRYNPDFTEPTSGIFLSRNSVDEAFQSVTPTDFSTYEKDDLEHVGWYYLPVNNKAPMWMEPYQNANINIYMISYVVPLYINGESVGIVGMDIDYRKLTDIVSKPVSYENGYSFLLGDDNKIMFHKDLDFGCDLSEIGGESLQKAIEKINNGEQEDQLISYSYQGKDKYLTLHKLDNGMRYVLTVPKVDIQKNAMVMKKKIAVVVVVLELIVIISGIFLGTGLAKPIKRITKVINETAKLNFAASEDMNTLSKRHDETGQMAKAVLTMRSALQNTVINMNHVKENILSNVTRLDEVMKQYYDMAEDNSSTTEELASGMEETASNTESISERLRTAKDNAQEISGVTKEALKESGNILDRALALRMKAKDSNEKAQTIYEDIASKAKEAMDNSKAVHKISELTEEIKGISSQTNLLALNASIEAARAGEAGRGFAVVATEIGNLASETMKTLDGINGIVDEVTTAVTNMAACMNVTMNFIQNNVAGDYDNFQHVSEQYENDANTFRTVMSGTDEAVEKLSQDMNEITDILVAINATVTQSSQGIYVIAEKSSDAVMKTQEGYTCLEENKVGAKDLEEIIQKFHI